MNRALIRFVTAVAASCGLLAGGLVLPASAATPVPPTNVITIPDQVTNTIDASNSQWLKECVAALTEAMTNVGDADGHPMSQVTASSYAMLLIAPLVAAEYAMAGN